MQYKKNYKCITKCIIYNVCNILYNIYGDCMKNFKIPSVSKTTSKSVRFPDELINDVEKIITGKDCTFSAFVVEAVRVIVDNIKEEEQLM